jgi:hypothetical protein
MEGSVAISLTNLHGRTPMRSLLVAVLAILLCWPVAAASADEAIGKVKGIRGLVSIVRDGATRPAFPNDKIFLRDIIITGSDGAIGILLEDNTLLSMGPISRLSMENFRFAPASNEYAMRLHMMHGTFVYQSGLLGKLAPHAVQLNTPVGRISMLKDTDFKAKFSQ